MEYREYAAGTKVSALGFGCMRLPEMEKNGSWYIDEDKAVPLLKEAVKLGVNYFDTAPGYCHTNSEITVGRALKPVRDKVYISTKISMDDISRREDYFRMLERSLSRLDTPYIDFYHFWGINKEVFDNKILKYDLLGAALEAKEQGLIKHISFSFHDKPEYIKYIIETAGIMESMLVQYNLLDRSNEEMIAYARGKGLGVAAMGPVGGGRLAAPADLYTRLTGKPAIATYELAFRFVLGNPNISCALSGMENIDMLKKNVEIVRLCHQTAQEEWEQIAQAEKQLRKFNELYCTGCAYCQPCPAGIDIPRIFQLYTYHNVYGLSEYAREQYRNYAKNGSTIKDCIGCGRCEHKCPQKLHIRKELALIDKLFKPSED